MPSPLTFTCAHSSTRHPLNAPAPTTHPISFPFPCHSCTLREARDREQEIRQAYNPRIRELGQAIWKARLRLGEVGPCNELLVEAKGGWEGELKGLEGERDGEVGGVWRGVRDVWGGGVGGGRGEVGISEGLGDCMCTKVGKRV